MHLLSPSCGILPRPLYEMARQDDWDGVFRLSKGMQIRGLDVVLAALAMDYGNYGGLKQLLEGGLDFNSTIAKQHLRSLGFRAPQVSLVEMAVALSSPSARGAGETMAAVFDLLLSRGAKLPLLALNEVVEHDDVQSVQMILHHHPNALSASCDQGLLSCQVYSSGMMRVLLDHEFPAFGKNSVAQWLWSVEPETCHNCVSIVELLVSRGLDIDAPNPNGTQPYNPSQTLLEHDLLRPDMVDQECVPFLSALIKHGARLDRLDAAAIISAIPQLDTTLSVHRSKQQAKQLDVDTPSQQPSLRLPRL